MIGAHFTTKQLIVPICKLGSKGCVDDGTLFVFVDLFLFLILMYVRTQTHLDLFCTPLNVCII